MSIQPLLHRTATGLIVPNAAVSRGKEDGQVNKCLSCGSDFALDQHDQYLRHVRNCSEAHADQHEEAIDRHRSNPLANVADQELFDHLKAGGN